MSGSAPAIPKRLLIVMPSWIGDCVMATPACRALRDALPGALIGALVRPGIDQLLGGLDLFDELHVDRPVGMMGPKRVASRLRLRRYECAVLLTNSFSTALIARLAGIPRRLGYDRDARHLLLTDRLTPLRRRDVEPYCRSQANPGAWAPVPACEYYHALARHLLDLLDLDAPPMGRLELSLTDAQRAAASDLLAGAGVDDDRLVMLCPGGNDPAKRWPGERFAQLADHLIENRGVRIVISGAPGEAEITGAIARGVSRRDRVIDLPSLEGREIDLGVLAGLIARCSLMVTSDTGPRHIAGALGVRLVTLFGPTDRRWTTIPMEREIEIVADPLLPEEEVANDHPERCAIDRIDVDRVIAAADEQLG